MQLIDTHVHLNFDVFQSDLEQIAQRWRENHIVRLVHSCVEPTEFDVIQGLSQRFSELYFAVGIHPLDVQKWTLDAEARMLSLANSDPKVVAIGETGLDFFKADNHDQQEQVFWSHLLLARQLKLPVIIHCRDAARPMVQLLERFWQQQGPVNGVMHCWSGTPEETQLFLDLGFYVSFSGIVTFKNAAQVHESAQMVPCDRILVETDCPFLAPVPVRGERRNEPANVKYVAQRVADLRDVSLETLAATTTQNACRLFRLSLPVQS